MTCDSSFKSAVYKYLNQTTLTWFLLGLWSCTEAPDKHGPWIQLCLEQRHLSRTENKADNGRGAGEPRKSWWGIWIKHVSVFIFKSDIWWSNVSYINVKSHSDGTDPLFQFKSIEDGGNDMLTFHLGLCRILLVLQKKKSNVLCFYQICESEY